MRLFREEKENIRGDRSRDRTRRDKDETNHENHDADDEERRGDSFVGNPRGDQSIILYFTRRKVSSLLDSRTKIASPAVLNKVRPAPR